MTTTSSFNVEDELALALAPIGCVRVTDLLGRAPGHENADFFFGDADVVAELKCLDEDKIHDDRIIEKASRLYLEELSSGRAHEVVFGEAHMSTAGYSAEFTSKISDLYRVPIERQVRKADKQIAETKAALNRMAATGLLLVANNNHTALDPWHAWNLVCEIMRKPAYDHIQTTVLFAGNLGATFPDAPERVDYWIEVGRPLSHAVASNFLAAARIAWFNHLGTLLGKSFGTIQSTDATTLARLASR